MTTLIYEPIAKELTFTEEKFIVHLEDARELSIPYSYFPRLARATKEQRLKYEISGGGLGLHWEDLDEDISVAGLFQGLGDRKI